MENSGENLYGRYNLLLDALYPEHYLLSIFYFVVALLGPSLAIFPFPVS